MKSEEEVKAMWKKLNKELSEEFGFKIPNTEKGKEKYARVSALAWVLI